MLAILSPTALRQTQRPYVYIQSSRVAKDFWNRLSSATVKSLNVLTINSMC